MQATCALIMRIHAIVKGTHSRKTAAFVRVRGDGDGALCRCAARGGPMQGPRVSRPARRARAQAAVAFCYITIPSVMSAWSRLLMFQLAMEVALINGCLPQAEAMLKASITLLADLPNMTGAPKSMRARARARTGRSPT